MKRRDMLDAERRALGGPAGACWGLLFLIAASLSAELGRADALRCELCGSPFGEVIYTTSDQWEGTTRRLCKACVLERPRCSMCGLPTLDDRVSLPDGRILCPRDSRGIVFESTDALEVCRETRDELGRLFSRFLAFPGTNVVPEMVDRLHMDAFFAMEGADRPCPVVQGYFRVRPGNATAPPEIKLLSHLRRAQLRAVYAHELAHAWVHEHLPPNRQLGRDAQEGFCELVACLLLQDRQETREVEELKKNRYTRGQVHLLINAEAELGFNAVMEWILHGADPLLDAGEPDRIRRMADLRPVAPAATPPTPPPAPAPVPVPDTLRLTGLLGSGRDCLALINGCLLNAGQARPIRWGTNLAEVRCLEIRSNAVVVQVAGESEPQVLSLASDRR